MLGLLVERRPVAVRVPCHSQCMRWWPGRAGSGAAFRSSGSTYVPRVFASARYSSTSAGKGWRPHSCCSTCVRRGGRFPFCQTRAAKQKPGPS
eukprot:6145922-Pyramimonas_sp.AAC.1